MQGVVGSVGCELLAGDVASVGVDAMNADEWVAPYQMYRRELQRARHQQDAEAARVRKQLRQEQLLPAEQQEHVDKAQKHNTLLTPEQKHDLVAR